MRQSLDHHKTTTQDKAITRQENHKTSKSQSQDNQKQPQDQTISRHDNHKTITSTSTRPDKHKTRQPQDNHKTRQSTSTRQPQDQTSTRQDNQNKTEGAFSQYLRRFEQVRECFLKLILSLHLIFVQGNLQRLFVRDIDRNLKGQS